MAWVALWWAFLHTGKYSFLMISPRLHDFSPFFLLISSPLGTADFLVLLELSGDGYSLLCSKKQPPRHNYFGLDCGMFFKCSTHELSIKEQLLTLQHF